MWRIFVPAILLIAWAAHAGKAHYDAHSGGVSTTDFDTSAELRTILTDETGSGLACFATAPTFTTSITLNTADTDAADSGVARFPSNTSMCWESSPAGTDVCVSVDTSEQFVFTAPIVITVTDPADTGAIRLNNNECIASEASPTGTDGTICFDGSEYWSFSEPTLVTSIAAKPAIFRGSGTSGEVDIEAYGGAPTLVTKGAGGTQGSPTTTASGDNLGNYVGQGYISGFSSQAAFQFIATETWGAGAKGTKMDFYTTPTGSTTLTKRMTLGQDGTLTLPVTTTIGWALVSGADTACNTTCTNGCVFGQNTATFAIVGCTDATADVCICAGSN